MRAADVLQRITRWLGAAAAALAGAPTLAQVAPPLYLGATGVPQSTLTTSSPTAATLPNYDPSRDSFAGLLVQKGGSGANESDGTKYQRWLGPTGGTVLSGPLTLKIWSAMKDFNTSKRGSVTAFLRECDSAGNNCSLIDSATLTLTPWSGGASTWVERTIDFGTVNHTVQSNGNRRLELKIIVDNNSDDDMWFAYATTGYPSVLGGSCGPTFTVTSTSNSGAGSLRQAITDANACPGLNTIAFNVTGTGCVSGVCTIAPTSGLPAVTDPVIIDGWTQPGWISAPVIEINGNGAGSGVHGLDITAGGSTVRGLIINRFGSGNGIRLRSNGGNTVKGCYIGTNAAGTAAAANDHGIYVDGVGNNTIGGTTAAERNVTSGNLRTGIYLINGGASGNLVIGNYSGVNAAGSTTLTNGWDGISIEAGAANNTIGGTTAAERNVLSGNSGRGIWIDGASTTGNVMRGNYIGVAANGSTVVGNTQEAVYINAPGNTVGGTASGAGNVLAGSSGSYDGVYVQSGTGNSILGNSIYGNGGLGIDLGTNGVNANNGTKNASLANAGMDFPVFTSATLSGSTLTVAGYVGSAANQSTFANARVEVFIADTTAVGNGEGRTYLGFLTTDAGGNFSGSIAGVSGITTGTTRLTATATDASNNTSEFGPNFVVSAAAATVGGFNAFESTTAAGAISGVIKTKVAGSAFSLSLVALNAGRTAVETSFTGSVTVELLDASNNSGALNATTGCRSSWSTIQTLSPNPAFAAGNNGRINVGFSQANAYRDVRVRVTYSSGGTAVIGCSTDNFAIRPASFASLQASDSTDGATGTARVLNNGSATSGVVHRAGRAFTVQASAVNAGGSVTIGYSGTPALGIASCAQPSGCTAGTLSGSLTGASGAVTGSATYSEAGVITVNLDDASFAAVDAADSTLAERTIATTSAATFGRFVPDAYRLSWSTSPTLAAALCASGPSRQPIMFAGQNFGFGAAPVVLATPVNASGAVLANARPRYAATAAAASFAASGTSLAFTSSVSAASVAHAATSTVSFTGSGFRFERGNTPVASFVPTLALTVTLSDSTETGTAGNSAIGHEAPLTLASVPFEGGPMRFHFGRIALRPAYGDVRQPLVVPLEVQSFNGTGWVALPDIGSCVVAAATDFAYVAPTGALSSGGSFNCATRVSGSVITTGGRAQIVLPRPGASDVLQPAAVTLRLNVGAASGLSCAGATPVAPTTSGLSWLSVQDGSGNFGADPAARVTWGRRQDSYLQLRERFD
jgi:hypothetical protein